MIVNETLYLKKKKDTLKLIFIIPLLLNMLMLIHIFRMVKLYIVVRKIPQIQKIYLHTIIQVYTTTNMHKLQQYILYKFKYCTMEINFPFYVVPTLHLNHIKALALCMCCVLTFKLFYYYVCCNRNAYVTTYIQTIKYFAFLSILYTSAVLQNIIRLPT